MPNTKKILFLFPHFLLPGGAANSTVRFARALNEKGHTTEIICTGISGDFAKKNSDLKFKILNIPNSGTFYYWALFPLWQIRINKELSKYPDYIFFPQVLPSNWWAWIFKISHRITKIVWYCHEPSAFIHSKAWIKAIKNPFMHIGAIILNPILKKIDIALEKQNNIVVCNSQFTANEYKKCYNKKVHAIIYPPININIIKEGVRKDKESYFLSVGRLSKFKNVDMLIDAFGEIHSMIPEYSLVIAGNGEEEENLKKIVAKKNLTKKIKFLGKVSDKELTELYKKARITIICSKNEPFGLVPVESMAHGTPVIAHKSGGPMETILNNKTGFLFENKNELAEYMKKIVSINKNDYFEIQRNCMEKIREYDIEILIKKIENIFIR